VIPIGENADIIVCDETDFGSSSWSDDGRPGPFARTPVA
jgi:hypothetical protein